MSRTAKSRRILGRKKIKIKIHLFPWQQAELGARQDPAVASQGWRIPKIRHTELCGKARRIFQGSGILGSAQRMLCSSLQNPPKNDPIPPRARAGTPPATPGCSKPWSVPMGIHPLWCHLGKIIHILWPVPAAATESPGWLILGVFWIVEVFVESVKSWELSDGND